MWSIFRETFLGKESGGEEYTRDVPATRGKSALIFRAGVIVLQQSMIYLNFEELNSMRLVCPRMRYEIHQWSIVIARYLMRKVGPHNPMDSDPCTAEMLSNTTAPLRMMRCLLEKRLMITHANGSFIFNATAIERGQPSRAFKRLSPLESKLGLMCNIVWVQEQGSTVKSSQLVAFCGEDEAFKPAGGQVVHMYEPTGKCWKCVRLPQSITPYNNASRVTALIHDDHIYLAGGRRLEGARGHWETIGSFHRMRLAAFLSIAHNAEAAAGLPQWETLPDLPSPRYGHCSLVYKNELLIAGGNQNSRYLTSVEKYNFQQRTWSSFPPLLEPRMGFSMFIIDDKLYVAGGNSSNSIDVFEDELAAGGGEKERDEEELPAVTLAGWKEVTRLPDTYSALRSIGAIAANIGPCIYFFGIDLAAADVHPPSPSMNTFPDSLRWDCYNVRTKVWSFAQQEESSSSSLLGMLSEAVGWNTNMHRTLPHSVRWGSAAAFPTRSL